jgi:hypothetical protein
MSSPDEFEGAICRQYNTAESAALWLQPSAPNRRQRELNYQAAKLCMRCPVRDACSRSYSRSTASGTINGYNAFDYYQRGGVYRPDKGGRPRVSRLCPVDQTPLAAGQRAYCSEACQREAKRQRVNARNADVRATASTVHLLCVSCGQPFSRPDYLTATTCSQNCASTVAMNTRKAGVA